MPKNRLSLSALSAVAVLLTATAPAAWAVPVAVATYQFNNTLAADEVGIAALTAIDPLGANTFQTENVFGTNRTVYRFDGSKLPVTDQAGLVLDTAGLLDGDDAYSVEMVFRFDLNDSSWESIFGVSNRQSDNAFYVDPGSRLEVFPSGDGPDIVSQNEWHHVTLTNSGTTVNAFLDGVFQFDLTSNVMDFSTYSTQNPDRLIHFFVDNVAGGGQGEFSDGAVSLIRLYDIELTPDDVATLPPTAVPAPAPLVLLLPMAMLLLGRRRGRAEAR